MTEYWIKFINGSIEATDYDPSGPQLFGGQTTSPVYPYRRLRNLTGLSTLRVFWGERPFRFRNYRVELITVGDLVLDVPSSRFPAPPGEQVEVYKGKLKLTSSHVGIVFQSTVTVRFPSAPAPDENTLITGTIKGVQLTPTFPFITPQMTGTFDSKFPIRYGQSTAIYEVNNCVLRGKLNI